MAGTRMRKSYLYGWAGFSAIREVWLTHDADEETRHSIGNSVKFSLSVVCNSFWPQWTAAHQASLSIINSWGLLKLMCIKLVMPSNYLILSHPLLLLPSILPSIRIFSNESVLHIRWLQLQHQSFQWIFRTDFLEDGLVGSPFSLRDSQESSPTPQFKSTNSSALNFLYSPTLTSIHDYWKNHSFD